MGKWFDHPPSTVGKGSSIAAAAAWIWSLAQELHMPWGSPKKRKKKNVGMDSYVWTCTDN